MSLHKDKRLGFFIKNHLFNYSDFIKFNSEVQSKFEQEITKEYTLFAVDQNLQRFSWTKNRDELNEMISTT